MPIEYEKWSPIEGMPDRFFNAWVRSDDSGTCVVLVPLGESPSLQVRFGDVLAYAVYDDFAFALGDIAYGSIDAPTLIVRNYDWPGPHKRYEEAGVKDVTCYRFGSMNAVVDVLASGSVTASWIPSNG